MSKLAVRDDEDILVRVYDGKRIVDKVLHVVPQYNYMPPLSTHDFERLQESIEKHQGLIAGHEVYHDENDNIIDGHHRALICSQNGLLCSLRLFTGSEREKLDYIWAVNVPRRHLTIEEKRKLTRHRLAEKPQETDKAIGNVVGLDPKTVAVQRRAMEDEGEIPPTKITGRGKHVERVIVPEGEAPPPNLSLVRDPLPAADGTPVDAADYRKLLWFEMSIGYPAPSEIERKRKTANGHEPYEREQERHRWTTGRMYLPDTFKAPRNAEEAQQVIVAIAGATLLEAVKRPLVTMLSDGMLQSTAARTSTEPLTSTTESIE